MFQKLITWFIWQLCIEEIFADNDFLIIGYILESSKRNFSELTRCIDRGHEYLHSRNADSKFWQTYSIAKHKVCN